MKPFAAAVMSLGFVWATLAANTAWGQQQYSFDEFGKGFGPGGEQNVDDTRRAYGIEGYPGRNQHLIVRHRYFAWPPGDIDPAKPAPSIRTCRFTGRSYSALGSPLRLASLVNIERRA